MTSLRLRLAAILLVFGAGLIAAAAAGVGRAAHREIDALFDAQLVETARSLLAQYAHDYDELDERRREREHHERRRGDGEHGDEADGRPGADFTPYTQDLSVFVRDAGGVVLYASGPGALGAGPRAPGFHDLGAGGDRERVFTIEDREARLWVTVGRRHAERTALTGAVTARLVWPFAALVPAMALLIWLGAGAGLRPLNALAASVAARAPGRLAPIDAAVPREVKPLVDEINGLLARLDTALAAERRFTADAAHELRTPLAALKTHAQVGLAAASDDERRRALQHVVQGADRAAHLVEQLLLLARLEPGLDLRAAETVDLRGLAAQAVSHASGAAGAPDVGLDPAATGVVRGDPVLLAVLLRNLVDNAVRYGGGRVDVAARAQGGVVVLEVRDAGPGIAPELRARVFDRFYRGLGHNAPGSGLGLSIVRRIAELHGGRVELDAGPGGRGLAARVVLPAAV